MMIPISIELCFIATLFAILCFIISIITSLIQFNILGWLFVGIEVGTFFIKNEKGEGK